MNFYAIRAIYFHEMSRAIRTIFQSFLSPVITTILYFVVFGSAIGSTVIENGKVFSTSSHTTHNRSNRNF